MSLSRIVYFSENRIEPTERDRQITELQRVAVSRNRRCQVTGALVYDDRWFAHQESPHFTFIQ